MIEDAPEVRTLCELVRYRTELVKDLTQIENRIHLICDKYEFPKYGYTDTDLFGKGGLHWLEGIVLSLDPGDQYIMRSELDRVYSYNTLIEAVSLKIVQQAVKTEPLNSACSTCEDVLSEDVKTLLTLIGVDYFTALLFLCEIGDINRFQSASKLTSWLGLIPHQSGDALHHGKSTKKGPPLVRWALIEAAHAAVRFDPHWEAQFNRISARRGKQRAYVAVARELAVTMYYMLKNNEPYRFGREKIYTKKLKKLNRLLKRAQPDQGEAPV